MRAEERFEYKGYVIDVLADHQESGQWKGGYLILKNGDQILSGEIREVGLHDTVSATQGRAVTEARKAIDALIEKDGNQARVA